MTEERDKRVFKIVNGIVFATMIVALAFVTTWAVIHDNDVSDNTNRTVNQTVQGCQRGNELRRAVLQIAEEQARRTSNVDEAIDPGIDSDATTLFDCRETTIRVTGIDPGPVSDFVDED